MVFGDRPLSTVLRPRFLTPAGYDALRAACAPLLAACQRAAALAREDRDFLAAFHLADWEHQLLDRLPPASTGPMPLARIDAFLDPDDGAPRLTEINAETPAGPGYADAMTEIFLALPMMRRFAEHWVVRPLPVLPHLLGVLRDAWNRSGGRGEPSIAIVDWDDVPTIGEFEIVERYLAALGIACRITTPAALVHHDGALCDADGTRIDLVYKRVLLHELVGRHGLEHPLLTAALAGDVVMVNPPQGKPLHKKAALAVLTDERHADRFPAAQREAVRRFVPWTRIVEERHTQVNGRRIDLLPWAAEHRETLVLKPNDDYGGQGIVLGWEVDAAAWRQALAEACTRPTVLQHRIALPTESFPAVHEGRLVFGDRIVDTAPFCWHNAWMDGLLTRISTETLVNVTAGGGSTVPTFVVEPRA